MTTKMSTGFLFNLTWFKISSARINVQGKKPAMMRGKINAGKAIQQANKMYKKPQ